MIIFKGKTNRTIKLLTIPDGFVVVTQVKGWMDDVLMLKYIEEIWMAHVKKIGCKESILTLDSSHHIFLNLVQESSPKQMYTCVSYLVGVPLCCSR